MSYSYYITTLGCEKNVVDSDIMIGLLDKSYRRLDEPDEAEIIIVNTCGFINDAKEESIDALLDMANYKQGKCQFLIAAGCLVQRYAKELEQEIPEIDAFVGTTTFQDILNIIPLLIDSKNVYANTEDIDRIISEDLPRHIEEGSKTAALKIAEGCDNRCTYCIIPFLRGKFRSRKIEDIVKEAKYLVSRGVRELVLIAQDTSRYGIDIYKEYRLLDLLAELEKIDGLHWIRIQYMYPDILTEEIIEGIAKMPKVLNYFDMPIQHASNKILKKMNRNCTIEQIENVIGYIRKHCQNYALRTTIIVGFPHETEADFEELLAFIEKNPIDKLGAFCYSAEENTPAFRFDNQVPAEIAEDRKRRLMEKQMLISAALLSEKVGQRIESIVEEKIEDGIYLGRTIFDAPEIDGAVYIHCDKERELEIGDFVLVDVTDALEYDLLGDVV